MNKSKVFGVVIFIAFFYDSSICQNRSTGNLVQTKLNKSIVLFDIGYPTPSNSFTNQNKLKSIDSELPEGVDEIDYVSVKKRNAINVMASLDFISKSKFLLGTSFTYLNIPFEQEVKSITKEEIEFEIHRPFDLHSYEVTLRCGGLSFNEDDPQVYNSIFLGMTFRFLSQDFSGNKQEMIFRNYDDQDFNLIDFNESNLINGSIQEIKFGTREKNPISSLNYYQVDFNIGFRDAISFFKLPLTIDFFYRRPLFTMFKGAFKRNTQYTDNELWEKYRFLPSKKIRLSTKYLGVGLTYKFFYNRKALEEAQSIIHRKF